MKTKMFASLGVALALAGGLLMCGTTNLHAVDGMLTIKGSDTMVLLGQAWAEAFMKKFPEANVSVQGGGSGTGISALINGTCDICQASRAMKGKEIQQCKDRNFVPVATVVALDGLSIAVNKANPVKSLTLAQLKDIYTGKVTNWKAVGGADETIVLLSRENSSGTYVYFQEHVLENEKYATTTLLMPSTKAIQQEVSGNKRAIGYGGFAYFDNQKNIKVVPVAKDAKSDPIVPTDDYVRSGKYPISRPLYLYTAGKAKGDAAKFIAFCLSAEGQKIVTAQDYVALKANK